MIIPGYYNFTVFRHKLAKTAKLTSEWGDPHEEEDTVEDRHGEEGEEGGHQHGEAGEDGYQEGG